MIPDRRSAPCSGQRGEHGRCYICDHFVEEHDEALVCRTCVEIENEEADRQAGVYDWWRSQQ